MEREMLYSTSITAKKANVTIKQLYYWEQLGIIKPQYEQFGLRKFRRYNQKDIQRLKMIKAFLEEGFTLKAAIKRVRERLGDAGSI